jgi:tRNA A37 methylthiotransferase MiaB
VKRERLRAVEELQARIAGEINSVLLGRTVEVLIEEEKGGKLGEPARPLGGRTRSGKLVHFSGEARPFDRLRARPGDLVRVVIERTSPWSLQGRLAGAATPRKAGDEPAPDRPASVAAL